MEGFPNNNEQAKRRERLVKGLREKGPDDLEVKAELQAWYEYQESVRGSEPGSEINDMIEQAELFRDAGFREQAIDILNDALTNAWTGFQDEELCGKIDGLIDKIKNNS